MPAHLKMGAYSFFLSLSICLYVRILNIDHNFCMVSLRTYSCKSGQESKEGVKMHLDLNHTM